MTLPWPTPISSSTRRPSFTSRRRPPPSSSPPSPPPPPPLPPPPFVSPRPALPKMLPWPWPRPLVPARAAPPGRCTGAERVRERRVDRPPQRGERGVGGTGRPFVDAPDRQRVAARDPPARGAPPDRGGAIRPGRARRVRDARLRRLALDR